MKMRVGVTGGTGFIGQYLIRDYGNQIDFVVPTQRKLYDELQPKAEYIYTDYDKEGFKRVFSDCDAVVHLGGKVMHGMSYDINKDVVAYMNNIKMSDDVFCACKELNIKNIINASSVAVYDQIDEIPVKETDPCQPNSVYGIMKITVEKLAELYNRRYGLKIKSYRFAQGLGFQAKMDKTQFWTILLKNSIEGKAIPLYGLGITGRDIIYVKDMTASIITGLGYPEISGCFNIGMEHICSNKEIAEAYCRTFDNKKGIAYLTDKQETGIRTCMNCEKAREILKFTPQYDVIGLVQDIKEEYEKYIGSDKEMIYF